MRRKKKNQVTPTSDINNLQMDFQKEFLQKVSMRDANGLEI